MITVALCIIVIILASTAIGALGDQFHRENKRWKDIKRRHPKW